ncbi:hypothetical protein Hanom_Chr03g00181931 [Helianthus anomalus]
MQSLKKLVRLSVFAGCHIYRCRISHLFSRIMNAMDFSIFNFNILSASSSTYLWIH